MWKDHLVSISPSVSTVNMQQFTINTKFQTKKTIGCPFCRVKICDFSEIISLSGNCLQLPLTAFESHDILDLYGRQIISCSSCNNFFGHTDGQSNFITGMLYIRTVRIKLKFFFHITSLLTIFFRRTYIGLTDK